jgi:hypothetical protein
MNPLWVGRGGGEGGYEYSGRVPSLATFEKEGGEMLCRGKKKCRKRERQQETSTMQTFESYRRHR